MKKNIERHKYLLKVNLLYEIVNNDFIQYRIEICLES